MVSESYPDGWLHATIHLDPATGTLHSDGDHRVRGWIEKRIDSLVKKDAGHQRKLAHIGRHVCGLIAKNAAREHEIKKLEDLLVWIHRTEQPIEEIRATISRTIPRRLSRASYPPVEIEDGFGL